jgi:hypothetical protein
LDLNVDDSFNFSMNGPKCPYASKNDVNDFIKIQKTSSSTIHRWQGKICSSLHVAKKIMMLMVAKRIYQHNPIPSEKEVKSFNTDGSNLLPLSKKINRFNIVSVPLT